MKIACLAFVVTAMNASALGAGAMTDSEARGICDDVAKLESGGKLDAFVVNLSRVPTVTPTPAEQALIDQQFSASRLLDVFRLEIGPGNPLLFISESNGGTCANHAISPVVEPSRGESSESDDSSDSREPSIGGEDSILQYRERFFLVNRKISSGRLRSLAWISPEGQVRPICTFETERVDRSVGIHQAPMALCEAVLAAPVAAGWQPYKDFALNDPEAVKQVLRIADVSHFDDTPTMETARIDVDNDGKVEDLVRLASTNSSACGYRSSRLQVLDTARGRIADHPLNQVLQMASTDSASNDSAPIEIYSVGGRQYLLSSGETGGVVYLVTARGAEKQCNINHRRKVRVSETHAGLSGR
jgi:hypothetical protein